MLTMLYLALECCTWLANWSSISVSNWARGREAGLVSLHSKNQTMRLSKTLIIVNSSVILKGAGYWAAQRMTHILHIHAYWKLLDKGFWMRLTFGYQSALETQLLRCSFQFWLLITSYYSVNLGSTVLLSDFPSVFYVWPWKLKVTELFR